MDVGTAYGLLLDEIYPRRGIMWPLPSADGERVALVQLREVRVDEVGEGEGRRLRPSRLADVCLLPAGGGDPQPLFGDGTAAGPAVWAPDGRRLVCERQGHGLQVVQLPPAVGGSAAAGATLEPPRTILREPLYRPPLAPGDLDLGLPRWAPDGQSLLVAVRDGPCTQLLQLDAGGRWRRELLAVEGYLIGWDWAHDGSAAVVVTRE
ncbi:MAG TPA: hypothetical protein VHS99_16085, partial [Chloroflexota bacterium]|nr:hypothetical protein [Chloroflexota bacterium]